MAKTLQLRRYPTSTLTNITGANGEIIIDTTLKTVTVHDGSTVGGITLARNSDLANAVSNITFDTVQANAAYIQANAGFIQANAGFIQANGAYSVANDAYILAANSYIQANAGFIQANTSYILAANSFIRGNSAYALAANSYIQANSAYARANNSINANTGGTITGDLNVTGNLTIVGTTTTVNTISVITTDSLISLASNNIYGDALDIGFYGAANTGASVNYFGLARQAGSNNFLLFKGISQEPTTNTIPAGSATAANVGTLIANVSSYSMTSNTLNVSSNIAAGNVNVTGAIYQNGVITPTLITMLTYNLAF
jgi:hypothetical protein